jgi:hypothetical protein
MPRLTIQQRVWVCLQYATVNNAEEVIRRWPIYWGNVPCPSKPTAIKTFSLFWDILKMQLQIEMLIS